MGRLADTVTGRRWTEEYRPDEPWCCIDCGIEDDLPAEGEIDDPEPPGCEGCGGDMLPGTLEDWQTNATSPRVGQSGDDSSSEGGRR